jgi:large subunit ribosomal protein L13
MQAAKTSEVIVNAEGLVLGRMCSKIAKRLLNGEQIIIVNAEKAIISGKKKSKVAEAKQFLEGKNAYKRLKVFMGIPKELKDQKMETVEQASAAKLKGPHFTLAELATEIGWNQGA